MKFMIFALFLILSSQTFADLPAPGVDDCYENNKKLTVCGGYNSICKDGPETVCTISHFSVSFTDPSRCFNANGDEIYPTNVIYGSLMSSFGENTSWRRLDLKGRRGINGAEYSLSNGRVIELKCKTSF
jgi:hypothetical protein